MQALKQGSYEMQMQSAGVDLFHAHDLHMFFLFFLVSLLQI
jgi:hypothetical protein